MASVRHIPNLSLAAERSTSLKGSASIGAWGNQLGNCHRDLVIWLGEPTMPKPASFDALLKIPKPLALYAQTQTVSQKMFLPHVHFSFLFDRRPDLFREVMLGGGDACEKMPNTFWSACKHWNDPRLIAHPMLSRPRHEHLAIPLSLRSAAIASRKGKGQVVGRGVVAKHVREKRAQPGYQRPKLQCV